MQIKLTDKYLQRRLAQSVPGAYYDGTDKSWYLDTDMYPASVRIAVKLFPHVRALVPDYADTDSTFRPNEIASEWAGDTPVQELLPNTPPNIQDVLRRYQAVDIAFSVARLKTDGGSYLGWDRGLGKTLAAISMMHELQAEHVIVVTPNNSKLATWEPQIQQWDTVDRFRNRVYNMTGSEAKRNKVIQQWRRSGGILLVHYEALRLIDPTLLTCDFIIVDEAHRLSKGSASRQSPRFYKVLKKIKAAHRLCMSGSIILNSPEDLFGALHFMYPTRYKSKWRDWNDRFLLYADGDFGKTLLGVKPEALDAMRTELSQFLLVRTKDDELPDLPERIEVDLYVTLSPNQKRIYDSLANDFMASISDSSGSIVVGSVLAQLIKLRMVATGVELLDATIADSSKLDLCEELLTDLSPKKVIVFTWHKATAYGLAARVGGAEVITGDTPMQERADIVRRFQEEQEPRVIIATIKTLGESVTLHAASDVIFVESSWVPADMEQAADRVRRIGQKNRVTIYNIIAKDTVDETKILPALESKDMLRRLVLGK